MDIYNTIVLAVPGRVCIKDTDRNNIPVWTLIETCHRLAARGCDPSYILQRMPTIVERVFAGQSPDQIFDLIGATCRLAKDRSGE